LGILQVGFLDAGQGDCTIIVYPDHSITLVDCGSIKNGKTVAGPISQAIARFRMKTVGKNTIDSVVLTHADQDHYNLITSVFVDPSNPPEVNNIFYGCDLSLYSAAVQKWINNAVANIYTPGNGAAYFCNGVKDPVLSRAGVDVYILSANATGNPTDSTASIKNQNSIVLLLVYADVRIFLMGDADTWVENSIITSCNGAGLTASLLTKGFQNVLKMGHHGSANSSSPAWIQAITPDTVFVSSDTRTFSGTGMPSQATLKLIQANTTIDTKALSHTYVQWDANDDYDKVGPTTLELCTTLYKIKKLTPSTFQSTGGSWYYEVDSNKPDAQRITFGWTGK
jgi:competence protein ComEC